MPSGERFAVEEQRFVRIKQVMEFNATQDDPDKKKDVGYKELSEYQEYLAERANTGDVDGEVSFG